MKAAIVRSLEGGPEYAEIEKPSPAEGEVIVKVIASALANLTKSRAAGQHYSSGAVFPFIPGDDGVGRLPDGNRVYFAVFGQRFGAMAEYVAVQRHLCVTVPDDVDDVTAAAAGNPGMSSWAALTERAKFVAGESVLINGATGVAGRLAIQIAKYLGAKKVIVTGRNAEALKPLPLLGADVVIPLDQPVEELVKIYRQEIRANAIRVVLDYLWGIPAEQLIAAIAGHGSAQGEPRIRFVQIGSMAGQTVSLAGSALRSSGLELLGTGLGSVSVERLVAVIGEMMKVIATEKFLILTEAVPLSEVATAWNRDTGGKRLVFTVGAM